MRRILPLALGVTMALLAAPGAARAETVDLGDPVEKGSSITYGKLVTSIFKGAHEGKDSSKIVTGAEKVFRQIGTKERTVLPAGTPLTSFDAIRVRGDGRRYLVLLCTAETNATEVPGGGAEVLAVFPQGSAEPQDVADVKGDTFCSFGEKAELSLGPDDAFTIVNSHSNSNQAYLDTALFHVHQGRLRRIDSVFTLSVRGLCEKSFEESLAWRTEPDAACPYPKIVATVTLVHGPSKDEEAECPKRKSKARTETYSESYHWDKGQERYVSAGKGFEALERFNQANM